MTPRSQGFRQPPSVLNEFLTVCVMCECSFAKVFTPIPNVHVCEAPPVFLLLRTVLPTLECWRVEEFDNERGGGVPDCTD
jgi:hypothetical protein